MVLSEGLQLFQSLENSKLENIKTINSKKNEETTTFNNLCHYIWGIAT